MLTLFTATVITDSGLQSSPFMLLVLKFFNKVTWNYNMLSILKPKLLYSKQSLWFYNNSSLRDSYQHHLIGATECFYLKTETKPVTGPLCIFTRNQNGTVSNIICVTLLTQRNTHRTLSSIRFHLWQELQTQAYYILQQFNFLDFTYQHS